MKEKEKEKRTAKRKNKRKERRTEKRTDMTMKAAMTGLILEDTARAEGDLPWWTLILGALKG